MESATSRLLNGSDVKQTPCFADGGEFNEDLLPKPTAPTAFTDQRMLPLRDEKSGVEHPQNTTSELTHNPEHNWQDLPSAGVRAETDSN